MDTQSRIDSILSVMRTKLEAYMEEESTITDPIEYEDKLLAIGQQFSIEVLESSLGRIPKSRNQKKSPDEIGSG